MMKTGLSIATIIFTVLGLVLLARTLYLCRRALTEYREYEHWWRTQVDMGLEQMQSNDTGEILRGLHIITALADAPTSAQALPRVLELTHSSNGFVAKPAEEAYKHMLDTLSEDSQRMASWR